MIACMFEIEKQIQNFCTESLDRMDNEAIQPYIDKLKYYEI